MMQVCLSRTRRSYKLSKTGYDAVSDMKYWRITSGACAMHARCMRDYDRPREPVGRENENGISFRCPKTFGRKENPPTRDREFADQSSIKKSNQKCWVDGGVAKPNRPKDCVTNLVSKNFHSIVHHKVGNGSIVDTAQLKEECIYKSLPFNICLKTHHTESTSLPSKFQ